MSVQVLTPDDVSTRVGEHLGFGEWTLVAQEHVNLFADATGDDQWIHVDVERATRESPFGGPIAHGYLTLAMLPALLRHVVRVQGFAMGVNYGADRVRFPTPVPVGARVRVGVTLAACDQVANGVQVTYDCTIEVEGQEKPACVARVLYRYVG
jgi:acyl dehydratase